MDNQLLKPNGRSLSEFKPLFNDYPAEKVLLEACRQGKVATISNSRPEQSTKENTVRASFLRFLALGGDEQALVHEMGVQLEGAWVDGDFKMGSAIVPHNLVLINCHLSNVFLSNSKVNGLICFQSCHINNFIAESIICNGLLLRNGFIATGNVNLLNAQIDGNLECTNAVITNNQTGNALICDRTVIKGSVVLNGNFTGTIRLNSAHIGGDLDCSTGKFNGKRGDALLCDSAIINGNVFLRHGFVAWGTVRLIGAHIGGELDCSNAKFDGESSGYALSCLSAVINGNVYLQDGFTATGTVVLHSTQIGGNLECKNSNFDGKNADALTCENAVVKGSVFFTENFVAMGTVRLLSMRVDCSLICTGEFHGKNGSAALFCDGAVIKGQVCLNDGFTAIGLVLLLGVQIGSDLNCMDGKFTANTQNDIAFACDKAVIKGSVYLMGKFVATGTVRLLGAQIGGDMECSSGATLICRTDRKALIADGMVVAGTFFFRELKTVKGIVSLVGVKVGCLTDNINSYSEVELQLDGFVYDKLITDTAPDAKSRLAWLDKQPASHAGLDGSGKNFRPQPWQQLQKVFYEMGHFESMRLVAIAFQNRRRKANLIGQAPENWWKPFASLYRAIICFLHWLYGLLFCYGYYTVSRLLIEMLIVWFACGVFYSYAAYEGVFSPSNPLIFHNSDYDVCKADNEKAKAELAKAELAKSVCVYPAPIQGAGNWYLCEKLREEYTGFSPLAYSLDLILPVVDLQQEHDWAPIIPTPKDSWTDEFLAHSLKHVTRLVVWFEILFGWLYSLLLVSVVSGLTKRREE